MFRKASSIFLFVTQIRESCAWYQQVLGFPPKELSEKFGLFEIGGTNLCFHLADAKSPLSAGGSVGYWWVENFNDVLERIISYGGKIYRGPIPTPDDQQICQIIDPFGNVIGLEGRRDLS